MRKVYSIADVARVICFCPLFAGVLFFCSLSAAFAEPLVVVDGPTYSFGSIREGDSVNHSFKLTNQSNKSVRISRVIPGCGCVRVRFPKEALPPGASASVDVVFLSEGFSGSVTSGIRVVFDMADISPVNLFLKGAVRYPFMVKPERLLFPDIVQSRGSDSQEVTVSGIGEGEFAVRALSRWVSVRTIRRAGGQIAFGVQIVPNSPVGELRERIVVRDSKGGAVMVPVFALIKPDLELSRSTITFLKHRDDQGKLSETVLLNYFGSIPFGAPRAVFQRGHRGITAHFKNIDPGRTWEVSFSVDLQNMAGSLDEQVTILGDDEDGPKASIRLLLSGK